MLDVFSTNNPLLELLIAVLLGAFLGLHREMAAQKSVKNKTFMGLRTMMLLCFMGAFSTLFPSLPSLPIVFFGALFLLVAIAYAHGSFVKDKIGITLELSALMTFWIGVLVGWEYQILAILVTLFLAAIDAFRKSLHHFAETLEQGEWFGAFELLALSGAVLPFLPRTAVDPWGIFVPFNIWLLVMLISGIGFVGYFLIKYLGARGSIPLIGFLGSVVSSTATTISLAEQSTRYKMYSIFAGGILIAIATMQLRAIVEIVLVGTGGFSAFLSVPAAIAFSSALCAAYFFLQSKREVHWWSKEPKVSYTSPFRLGPALKFALLFVVVLFALAFGQKYFGASGAYVTAFFSGLIDIDAIILSSLEAVRAGGISHEVAQNSMAIAIFCNTLVKIGFVAVLGGKELFKRVAGSIVFVTAIGAGAFFLL